MVSTSGRQPRTITPLKPRDRVVVIGAGPAGLTAAYELAKRTDARVTVLEADQEVGGISRTAQYNGFRFDLGGHRFFTKIRSVEALWHEILGEDFIRVPRLSRIYYNGKYFDYPLKPMNALRGLGLLNAAAIVLSYLKWHYRPYPVEENFEQWVTNRFGRRLYQTFFKTYTEKVWGLPCTEIRAEWAAQRIQGLSLARAVLNATSLNKRSTDIKTLIHEFQYPRLGPGQMWETCRDHIVARGHDVLMGHAAKEIVLDGDRVTGVVASTPAGDRLIPAEHVISSMPLRTLVRTLRPAAPTDVATAAEGLAYRDFLVVALMLRRDRLFPDNWIYIHTPGVRVGRIQNFNNWSAAMVPQAGVTCLGMEYFCFKGDDLWTRSDADLGALAATELERLGLARQQDVFDSQVVRVPKAYPIYDSAYRGHVDRIRDFIDPLPNLHTVGRNGMHKYNNQDHSMLTAMMTVDNMLGASLDVWTANTDYEYHEEQRVEEEPARPEPARQTGRAERGLPDLAAAARSGDADRH
jgi:protoporphyrinogen oxidase